jgi:hypothetical protein
MLKLLYSLLLLEIRVIKDHDYVVSILYLLFWLINQI